MRATTRLRHALSPTVQGLGRGVASALAAAVLLAAGPAAAQSYFPTDPPAPVLSDDFSLDLAAWTVVEMPSPWGATWAVTSSGTPSEVTTHWGQHLRENAATSAQRTALLANATAVGYGNLQLEFELSAGTESTSLGAVWDVDLATDSGYILSFSGFPASNPGSDLEPHAMWTLVKRDGAVSQTIGSGAVRLLGNHATMIRGSVYRVRVSAFCGNIRVEAQRVYEDGDNVLYDGGCAGHPSDTPNCWDTILQWTDPTGLAAGQAGLYSASTDDQPAEARFDNATISVWPSDCLAGCTAWTAWDESWATGDLSSRDVLQFKLLYEGVLLDPLITADTSGAGRIDCEAGLDDKCDGMRLLVDLPGPTDIVTNADRQVQDEKIAGYLEPVSTAVRFLDDGGSFSFAQDYNDPLRADYVDTDPYNPIPIVASGDTPIAAAMMDAYDWYVEHRSGDGAWTEDSLDVCRKWYVLLITDGEEHCGGDVCAPGQAASLFADPDVDGLPEVQVSTIGFSENVGDDSPLRCLATDTGGTFATASDAQGLADQLNAIINLYQVEDRSFASVTVSPQLSTSLASADTSYLLSVPVFVPQNGKSIWDGHLHTYLLDSSHPSPPVDADGELDATSPYYQWDAGAALESQLRDASAFRNLYWPSDTSGSWARVSLATVKTNATRKAEFRALTGDSQITDAVADQIVDFMYFFNVADRPAAYPALGDIYHSRPVIVGAPRNYKYLLRNIDDYPSFASTYEHRRRVVFAGGNDGLFHAFDIGQFVTGDNAYDTGTGKELFGLMPQTVMPRLYGMAAQSGDREQQYMVDGQISSADVHIDINYTGDPGDSDPGSRTWRTIVLATMRAGGRSVLALDVTQPDDPGNPPPADDPQPTCLSGGGGCSAVYPRVMWEFSDETDADGGCSAADAAAGLCNPADYWDLGDTWSKPLIARVRKATDDAMFVAFFGGGNDPQGDDTTGNYFYGVDIETGQIVFKENVNASIPGGVAGIDKDDDGFTDVVYFGTTNGFIYKLDLTSEAILADDAGAVPPGKRVSNWTLEAMYSFGADVKFYMTPVLVPVLYDATGFRYAVALGAGDRDNIDQESDLVGRFYFALDYPNGSGSPRTEANLQGVAYDAPAVDASTTYFRPADPTDPVFGWYLILRAGEKVSTDALVAAEKVVFPTFVRTPLDPEHPPTDSEGNVICQASGIGRIYEVNYLNANPEGNPGIPDPPRWDDDGEDLGLITGLTLTGGDKASAIDNATKVKVVDIIPTAASRITNWRQE